MRWPEIGTCSSPSGYKLVALKLTFIAGWLIIRSYNRNPLPYMCPWLRVSSAVLESLYHLMFSMATKLQIASRWTCTESEAETAPAEYSTSRIQPIWSGNWTAFTFKASFKSATFSDLCWQHFGTAAIKFWHRSHEDRSWN